LRQLNTEPKFGTPQQINVAELIFVDVRKGAPIDGRVRNEGEEWEEGDSGIQVRSWGDEIKLGRVEMAVRGLRLKPHTTEEISFVNARHCHYMSSSFLGIGLMHTAVLHYIAAQEIAEETVTHSFQY
jgi:hypothetical protein